MDRAPSDLLDDLLRRAKVAGADAADAMLVEHRGLAVTRRLGQPGLFRIRTKTRGAT
jgi:PmbA protein